MEVALLLGVMIFLLAYGVPIAFSIGISSGLFLMVTQMKPLILIAQRTVLGTDSFPLLAIPLFTLGGYLMESGGLSKRLVGCIEKLLGGAPGSVGTVTIVCCTIFAALTGSGPATVAAIGAIMLPAMLRNGYGKSETGGILAAAGSLGPVIPPSICMIVYGSTMNVSIPEMFIAAIVPGLLLAASFVAVNLIMNRKKKAAVTVRYSRKEVVASFIGAAPVLLLPVLILGGIYTGIFTPTEAAVTCVIYSLALGIAYREMKLSD